MTALYVRLRFPPIAALIELFTRRPHLRHTVTGRFAHSSNLVFIDIWEDAWNDGFGAIITVGRDEFEYEVKPWG
jgi:hypothetical protein